DVESPFAAREIVVADQAFGDAAQRIDVLVRNRKFERIQSASQPPIVAFVLEEFAIDQAPYFVDAVAEDESAVENRELCLVNGQVLAVEVHSHGLNLRPFSAPCRA